MISKRGGNWIFCRTLAYIFLLTTNSENVSSARSNANDMPESPFSWENCRFLFNEFNIYPDDGGTQFIELMKYCTVPPPRSLPILMHKFKILVIDDGGNLLGTCALKGSARHMVDEYLLYTIGGTNIAKKDMSIDECQFVLDEKEQKGIIPVASGAPVGIALVHNNDPKELAKLELLRNEKGTLMKTLLAPEDHVWIMSNIQDLYVYTSSSPYVGCAVFQLYYSGYDPSKGRILRDWKATEDVMDMSLSRCGTTDPSSSSIIASPFQPELFFMAPKSPGLPNRCHEAFHFVIEEMLPMRKRPKIDVSSLTRTSCTIINDGPYVESRGVIASSALYKIKQNQAESRAKMCRRELPVDIPQEVGKLTATDSQFYQLRGTSSDHKATQTATADVAEITRKSYFKQDCDRLQKSQFVTDLQKMETMKTGTPQLNSVDILDESTCFWFEWYPALKKFRCKLCHAAITKKLLPERSTSDLYTLIMTDVQGITVEAQGVQAKSKNRKLLQSHNENPLHKIAVEYEMLQRQGYNGEDLIGELEKSGGPLRAHTEATENLFTAGYSANMLRVPFFKFKAYHAALKYLGVNIGSHYANSDGHKLLTMSISKIMHGDFCERLARDKPELSILLDTSSDVASLASLAIVFQTYDEHQNLRLYLYRILDVSEGESTVQLFKKFEEALKEDNLYNYVKESTVGYASDGAKNVRNFKTHLNKIVRREVVGIHCQAHRIQLAMKHAWEDYDYLGYLEAKVNQLHSTFNSRSPKKKEVLRTAMKEDGQTKRKHELKKIQSIRWVNSKLRALRPVLTHWSSILKALQRVGTDKTFKKDQREKAIALKQTLKGGTFIATLAFEIDVAEQLSTISLSLQEKGNTLIAKKEKRIIMLNGLRQFKMTYGPTLNKVLSESKSLATGTRPSLKNFEEEAVLYKDEPVINNMDSSEYYLYDMLEEYIDSLIEQVEVYFPADPSDNFEVLDAKRWDSKAPANFGHKEILDANKRLKWGYGDDVLCKDWDRLRKSIMSHKDFQSYKLRKPEDFWTHFLKDSTIDWTISTKQIIKDILTIPPSTAEVERVYSHYTAIKTHRRWNLDVSTVEALVRMEINGPKELENFDSLHYAKMFLQEHSRADDTSRRVTWNKGVKDTSSNELTGEQAFASLHDDFVEEDEIEQELAFDDEQNLL